MYFKEFNEVPYAVAVACDCAGNSCANGMNAIPVRIEMVQFLCGPIWCAWMKLWDVPGS